MRSFILATLLLFAGCAAMDQFVQKTHNATTNPVVTDIADSLPWGRVAVDAVGGLSLLYLYLRKRAWKSAFTTVVKTVEPFIPTDETARTALRAKQGTTVTGFVKAVKG